MRSVLGHELELRGPARDHAAQGGPGGRHPVRGGAGHGDPRGRGGGRAGGALRGRAAPHRTIALSPGGRLRRRARERAGRGAGLTLLCGRYEGFDERVHEHLATDVVSIGPYVLSGGELAAMVVCGRGDPEASRRARARGERGRGVVQRGARGGTRVPALHAPVRVARAPGARGAPVRGPRPDPEWRLGAEPRAPPPISRSAAGRGLAQGARFLRYHCPSTRDGSHGRVFCAQCPA